MIPLREHVRELHPNLTPRRSNTDLARQHARAHHRLHCNHIHEPDNAGALIGPGSDQRRPSGWGDGSGVIMRTTHLPDPVHGGDVFSRIEASEEA